MMMMEGKRYERGEKREIKKGNYKTGTNEVRNNSFLSKRYKVFSLLSFCVGVGLSAWHHGAPF